MYEALLDDVTTHLDKTTPMVAQPKCWNGTEVHVHDDHTSAKEVSVGYIHIVSFKGLIMLGIGDIFSPGE